MLTIKPVLMQTVTFLNLNKKIVDEFATQNTYFFLQDKDLSVNSKF